MELRQSQKSKYSRATPLATQAEYMTRSEGLGTVAYAHICTEANHVISLLDQPGLHSSQLWVLAGKDSGHGEGSPYKDDRGTAMGH